MKSLSVLFMLCFSLNAFSWTLPSGSLDGTDWKSESLKGKTFVLFYVSPSKKDLNNGASEAIKAQKFNSKDFSSVAVIDLKSSWIPNGLIMSAIKKKQKKYPRTIYLKDKKRHLHKTLNLNPTGNDVFVFNKNGDEIFRHNGKLNEDDIQKMIASLKESISKK